MFPSMEIFLRRFWKLESREPVVLWQCRLAGVDMAAPGGSTQRSRLFQPTFKSPANWWAGWPPPATTPREEAEAFSAPSAAVPARPPLQSSCYLQGF